MAEPGDEFFLAQEAELAAFEDARVLRFIRYLEQARRELDSELRGFDGGNKYRRVQGLIDQIDAIEASLRANLKDVPDPTEPLAKMVARHQGEAFTEIVGAPITITANTIPVRALAQMAAYNFDKVTSISASSFNELRSVIFTRIGIKGENPRKVAAAITGPEGTFAKPFHIVENVLRTESSTMYNEMRLGSLQDANQALDLGLNKRIVEQMNTQRNHPISRVINNQVQHADKPFRAKVADVRAAVAELRYPNGKPRRISDRSLDRSIFWEKVNGYYVGQNLPAHYRERGIVVPTAKPVTPI